MIRPFKNIYIYKILDAQGQFFPGIQIWEPVSMLGIGIWSGYRTSDVTPLSHMPPTPVSIHYIYDNILKALPPRLERHQM